MRKFKRSFNGYDVNEVNAFLDDIIRRVESIIREEERIKVDITNKDNKIKDLEKELDYYKSIENDLSSSINQARESSDYIKRLANSERDAIISDARKNANRIISDALLRAEKTEFQAQTLRKNINLFKSRVRTMLNQQLDIIDDLDKEELN